MRYLPTVANSVINKLLGKELITKRLLYNLRNYQELKQRGTEENYKNINWQRR
jgi:hypothetical protein